MLSNIVKLSFRTYQSTKFLQVVNATSIITCKYSRFQFRKPVAIVNEDELYDDEKEIKPKKIRISKRKFNPIKLAQESDSEHNLEPLSDINQGILENDITSEAPASDNTPIYQSLRDNDKFIMKTMLKVKSRKKRSKNDLIFLEGTRLISDAIQSGLIPEMIFFTRISDVNKLPALDEVKLYKISYQSMQLWSNLTTAPGIIGIFKNPPVQEKNSAIDCLPLTIICDNVREPGNMGSILRAAAGVGCEQIILTKGCVDIWDSKVLRSAAGTHFRIPIHTELELEEILMSISSDADFYMADNNSSYKEEITHDNNIDLSETNVNNNDSIHESLNSDESKSKDNNDFSQNKLISKDINLHDEKLEDLFSNKSFKFTNKARRIIRNATEQLPIVPYYTLDYTKNQIVLIIGGETEGVSFESLMLLHRNNGTRINIPLANNVNSLNNGVALGIIAFEIKRQFLALQRELK